MEKSKDYKWYERAEGKRVICHVVGETPEALARGIAEYRELYRFHDCGMPYEQTSLTANLKRWHTCD
jgi:hypothetical protein